MYWTICRGPGILLAVIWFGSSPVLSPSPVSKSSIFLSLPLCRAGRAYWREGVGGGRGAKLYDSENAWSSINHLKLSVNFIVQMHHPVPCTFYYIVQILHDFTFECLTFHCFNSFYEYITAYICCIYTGSSSTVPFTELRHLRFCLKKANTDISEKKNTGKNSKLCCCFTICLEHFEHLPNEQREERLKDMKNHCRGVSWEGELRVEAKKDDRKKTWAPSNIVPVRQYVPDCIIASFLSSYPKLALYILYIAYDKILFTYCAGILEQSMGLGTE